MRLPDTKDFPTNSKSCRRAEWVGTASVFAMASFLFPQAALATCAPAGPGTTECTGSNPNTVVTQSGVGAQTVNITTGADVSSTASTVSVNGADATITNDGTVSTDGTGGSSSYSALIASGSGGIATIDNRGTVASDGLNAIGARLLVNGGAGELINSGSINATGGLTSGSFGPLAASISAISSDVSVTNSGSISGDGIGLFVQHSGTGETSITNAASGVISGVNTGILIRDALGPVQILNAGSIIRTDTGTAGFVPGGITIFDQNVNAAGTQVSIVNTGLIDGGGSWGILANQRSLGALEVDNRGTINGGILSTGGLPAVINNQGIIGGDVIFGDGNDFFNLIGNAARLNGDFNAGAGIDTMQFSNVAGWVYSGSIDNVEALSLLGSADITFDNASINLNGAVGSFNILSAATLRVAGNSTIRFNDGGAITNDGTIVLAPGAIFDATSFGTPTSFASTNDSTVRFVLDTVSGSSAISGQLRANTIAFQAGSQIDVDVQDLSLLINGRTIDVAVAGTSLTDASGAVTDNSILFDFSKDVVGGTTLRLTMQQLLSIADTINPANPNSAALAAALQDLIDSGTASGDAVSTILGQYSDAASLEVGVGDFAPDDSNSVSLSQLAGIDRVHGLIRSRLADRPLTDKKQNLWIRAGRDKQSLDAAAFTEGFDGKGWSVAGGVDTELGGGNFIVGAGFDHQKSDLDRTGTRVAKGDLTSDRLFLYASNTTGPIVFNADAGIGRGKADLARSISALGEIARGRSTTKQIFGRAELGYRFGDQGWSITPVAGLQASRLKTDGYTEAGSAGALSYADRTVTSTKGDAGAIVSWQASDNGSVRMRLDADLRLTREFKDLDDPLMVRFAGSSSNFAYQVNAPGGTSKQAELGAHFDFGSSATLSFVYRGNFADGASTNAGAIALAIGF